MSGAKCIRLVNMMGLERLDGNEDDLPPSLAPALTWVELEERRRVFWGGFTIDAHASISTGWPNLVDSNDVRPVEWMSRKQLLTSSRLPLDFQHPKRLSSQDDKNRPLSYAKSSKEPATRALRAPWLFARFSKSSYTTFTGRSPLIILRMLCTAITGCAIEI